MAPKEYNLAIDFKFSGKHKDWEATNEKFLTKLLDNGLEFVPDYAQLFFDAIQASHKPGGGFSLDPPDPIPADGATPATARRLPTTGRSAAPALGAGASDDEDITADNESPTDDGEEKIMLMPWMLNDPKYEKIWVHVMKHAPSGDMQAACKDVKNALLSANHHKFNDKTAIGSCDCDGAHCHPHQTHGPADEDN